MQIEIRLKIKGKYKYILNFKSNIEYKLKLNYKFNKGIFKFYIIFIGYFNL